MTVNIEYETDKKLELDYEDIINKVIDEAVSYEKCPYEVEVNVTLTDHLTLTHLRRNSILIQRIILILTLESLCLVI